MVKRLARLTSDLLVHCELESPISYENLTFGNLDFQKFFDSNSSRGIILSYAMSKKAEFCHEVHT